MRGSVGLRGTAAAALVIGVAVVAFPPPAAGQDMSLQGDVRGTFDPGSRVTFRVSATHPDGWRALNEVLILLDLHGATLEELAYEVDLATITLGEGDAVVGTANTLEGRFLEVRGLDVSVTTSGQMLTLSIRARVLEDVPAGTRVLVGLADDEGAEAQAVARTEPAEDEGFPWGTVALAVLAAAVTGGALGARVASHRRRGSIYGTVARRIAEERGRR